jgi:cellulose 1,4-beta-cellobiosidase
MTGAALALQWVFPRTEAPVSLAYEAPIDILIGRGSECHVRLEGNDVSRRHAAIHTLGEKSPIELRDLGSHNGLRVNGCRVSSSVLAEAGGADKVRGFAVNVANYDSLQDGDLPRLEPSDPATGELKYIDLLNRSLTEAGITGKAFVVDTSRNGRSGIRTKSGSWCNVAGAGLGERPQANPTPFVDAYLWIKPPGESDGGSDPNQDGFDEMCGARSPDAAPNAPHAGSWFHSYFVDLAKKANPPL